MIQEARSGTPAAPDEGRSRGDARCTHGGRHPRGFPAAPLTACLALAGLAALAAVASAQSFDGEKLRVELGSSQTSVRPGIPVEVGVRFELDPGWHVYWRNSGDSGVPVGIEWDLPEGVTAGPIEWPVPERIETGHLVTFGYSDEVLLPVTLKVARDFVGETVDIVAKVDWLVCEEVCLDGEARLELSMPVSTDVPKPDADWAPRFKLVRASLPRPLPEGSLFASARAGQGHLMLNHEDSAFAEVVERATEVAFFPADEQFVGYQPASLVGGNIRLPVRDDQVLPEGGTMRTGPSVKGVLVLDGEAGRSTYWVDLLVFVRPMPPHDTLPGDPGTKEEPPSDQRSVWWFVLVLVVLLAWVGRRRKRRAPGNPGA